jgi:hypothetical protein
MPHEAVPGGFLWVKEALLPKPPKQRHDNPLDAE